jgi:hypothetical protein
MAIAMNRVVLEPAAQELVESTAKQNYAVAQWVAKDGAAAASTRAGSRSPATRWAAT